MTGVQVPRLRSVPPYVCSKGVEALQVSAAFGLRMDPWQELVLTDGCGVREDGKWAAFEVAGEVARQNGKGGIIEARELAGIFAWGERLILHSAHEFPTATEAMLRMEDILAGTPEYAGQVKSISRSHGSEGFIFKSGQRLRYRTRTRGGGRGFTGDALILDEAMVLQDAFVAALLPTLSARSMTGNPQVWYFGSAVDQLVHEHGVVFARLRARALAGGDPSLAYFGWSGAPPFDENGEPVTPDHPMVADLLDSVRARAEANPALSIRIAEEHIEKERRSMGPREFAVERLGIGDWPAVNDEGGVFDMRQWGDLADDESKPQDPVVLAFDVTPARTWGSVGASGRRPDGFNHVELIDRRRGTGWMADRIAELNVRHRPSAVICDGRGPAASLIPDLEDRGVTVTTIDAGELAQACGRFFDAVDDGSLRHLGQPELTEAVRGAASRPLGEAFAWSRRHAAADISPLMVATLALFGLTTLQTVEVWAAGW